jgi:hypothetical protein
MGIYGSQFLNVTLGYADPTFPMVIQFSSGNYVQTVEKSYFVVQDAVPLKLVFPFQYTSRSGLT